MTACEPAGIPLDILLWNEELHHHAASAHHSMAGTVVIFLRFG